MASQFRIPDLDSMARRPGYKGWEPLTSYSLGQTNQGTGAGGKTPPQMNGGTLQKQLDELSVQMIELVRTGRAVSEVAIFTEGRAPGSASAILLFSNVQFSSYQMGGTKSGEDLPIESFSFEYQKLELLSVVQYLARKGVAAAVDKLQNWFR
jgi:type VI protein secretion system component Hcp